MLNARENIVQIPIEDEMKDSYLVYSMSVIISRAIPMVEDGLKPSQRRVLVAMNDLGLSPNSRFRKCAKICGDTSGNYHPHSGEGVYPTLVRMAQDFSMRYPLVEGQGNFGSIDGDPPAAMRYTEARLTPITMYMLEDLDKETVDFVPNYDGTRMEPIILPSKFPNLLCNGSSGIAVGMATNIPPHNLTEVATAIIKVIENPDIKAAELLRYVTGPDFPTGGIICGRSGIISAYKTGRGRITVRARVGVEQLKNDKRNIIVTEIPYQLNKTNLIEGIAALAKTGRITGITDIRDESDKEGMRLVIELRRGEEENVVLNQLFSHTELQKTYSIIMIALVGGRPVTLGLRRLIDLYIDHRINVIERRTRFLLDKAEKRAHILEGLRIALANIDAVIETIKKSPDVEAARARLMKNFKLSEVQANAILDMRLQRLTALEIEKVESEYKELQVKIKEHKALLADRKLVLDIIKKDLKELRDKFGDDRRTEIISEEAETFSVEDLIAEENVAVTISHEGYIKRLPLSTYRKQHRGGKGITGAYRKEGDFLEHLFVASTHDYILFFTNLGRLHWLKVYDIPQMSRISKGRAIINMLHLDKDEVITSMIPVRTFDDRQVVMATNLGTIKKTPLEAFSRPKKGGIIAINLEKDERLIGVQLTHGSDEIILGTYDGQAIRFKETDIRSMGRSAHGVKGITLRKGDYVKDMVVVEPEGDLLTVCENGHGKKTPFSEYRLQHRGGSGIINIKTSERNGKVVGLKSVKPDDDLVIITAQGMVLRISATEIRAIGRATQGVRLASLEEGDRIVGVARVAKDEGGGEGGNGGEEAEEPGETEEAEDADIPAEEEEVEESGGSEGSE
jgi:DNA gyrase subunit A